MKTHACRTAAKYVVKYRDGKWWFCVGVEPWNYEVAIEYCPFCGERLAT